MVSPFCAKDVIERLEEQKRARRRKRKSRDDANQETMTATKMPETQAIQLLPIGYFHGTTVFRNRLHPEEHIQDGFFSLSDLIPPNWSEALATTFCAPEAFEWVESVLETSKPPLELNPQFVLVHHGPHTIGEGELKPVRIRRRRKSGWYTLSCQPHTGGCMHPKILLFRTPLGLRVVIGGNNFYQYQWENDRDCFWAQDFPVVDQKHRNAETSDPFPLDSFLRDLCRCKGGKEQTIMDQHLSALFDQIDLFSAKASLVFSFPRAKEDPADRGGWKQLSGIVQDRLLDDYDTENDNNSPNVSLPDTLDNTSKSILYTMSGSTGDVDPIFLKTMKNAMSGQETFLNGPISWQSIKDIQCLIPSKETAMTMYPVWNGRLISRDHWFSSIPKEARSRLFNDAVPNPSTRLPCHNLLPFAHAKFMYFRPRRNVDTAVLYVGSHNFSKAAWGIADQMPTNVEVGVVLSTADNMLQAEWETRLPCRLPMEQIAAQGVEFIPVFQGDMKSMFDPAVDETNQMKVLDTTG